MYDIRDSVSIQFFISDSLTFSANLLNRKENSLMVCKMTLRRLSNLELGALFGFRSSDFNLYDEKGLRIVIDSRREYYLLLSFDN